MSRTAPDRELRQLAMWLDIAATETTAWKQVSAERYTRALTGTSIPRTDTGPITTSRGTSTTESRALAGIHQHDQTLEQRARVETIRNAIRSYRAWMRQDAYGADDAPPEPEPLRPCKEGQQGKEGATVWGDPLCDMPPTKGGCCDRHYFAWYRHRKAKGIDTTKDFAA
jgi:hypothetical protein